MWKKILGITFLFLFFSSPLSYALMPCQFSEPISGLSGNAIAELVWDGKWLWAGTVDGVSRTSDGGLNWYTYNTKNGLSHNDVTAMAATDTVLWVALAYNKLHQGETYPFGGGFNKTTNLGDTWRRIEPPQATNAYYKLAFDITIVDSVVWAACIYGGLIRFWDDKTWENIYVDSFAQQDFEEDNTANNRNNIFFAVIVDTFSSDTLFLWTGNCAGIYKFVYTESDSADTVINYNSEEDTLSGDFVFALAVQKYHDKKVVWAGTRTDCDGGVFGACKSTDDGQTWEIISELEGYAVNNYDFQDSVVWAATNSGLKRSTDWGESWEVFNFMEDKDQPDQKVFSTEFYSIKVVGNTIWAGNADGLVKTTDDGATWKVYRSFVPIGEKGSETTYAYPNPFSPKLFTQVTRIHYKPETDGYVTIKIYDFAMNLVKEIQTGQRMGGIEYDEIWDGKNDEGDMVANGTYFFKLEAKEQTEWGKIVVIK